MQMKVKDIAQLINGEIDGDAECVIIGVNGIAEARPGDLTFARSARYYPQLRASLASAALVPDDCANAPMTTIRVAQPDLAFLMMLQRFAPPLPHPSRGIDECACVAKTAKLGEGVSIGPFATVEADVVIGANTVVYAGAYIGKGCLIGRECIIYPNVILREETEVGDRCILHAGACIGSDGFGFADFGGCWNKIPQIGKVIIESDVEIGSNTTIDRATFGVTFIGEGTKIDNLVQIGHNVRIGSHCAIAGKAGIAGSAQIGNHVRIGADAGVAGHIQIGDGVTIGARAGVTRSVESGKVVSGFPAIEHARQRRVMVAQERIPEMLRRIAELERELNKLKDTSDHEAKDNC